MRPSRGTAPVIAALALVSTLPVAALDGIAAAPPRPVQLAQAETPSQLPDAAPSQLPGGASSLRETHGGWLVSCVQNESKTCSLSQSQVDKNTRKRVLTIELGAPANDVVNGVLVLPFGLLLDHGITLQVDEGEPGQKLRFHTCLPAGCVVRLGFDAAMLEKLRAGTALNVNAAAAENGSPVAFSISLVGLTSALDRVTQLMK